MCKEQRPKGFIHDKNGTASMEYSIIAFLIAIPFTLVISEIGSILLKVFESIVASVL